MEVEVKLRLSGSDSYRKLLSLLSPFHIQTHHQQNYFFDGAVGELSSRRAVLRVRFYEGDAPRCVLSLKAKAILVDGVSRVEEDEEAFDTQIGRDCVEEPRKLRTVEGLRVLKRAIEEFGVGEGGFVGLGGFRNLRNVYEWNGLMLEVDETMFDFGTCYEIECESSEPEKAKNFIEGFLKANEIEYSNSEASKFAIFRAGKLPK